MTERLSPRRGSLFFPNVGGSLAIFFPTSLKFLSPSRGQSGQEDFPPRRGSLAKKTFPKITKDFPHVRSLKKFPQSLAKHHVGAVWPKFFPHFVIWPRRLSPRRGQSGQEDFPHRGQSGHIFPRHSLAIRLSPRRGSLAKKTFPHVRGSLARRLSPRQGQSGLLDFPPSGAVWPFPHVRAVWP
ncbi:unnamed protein product [Acanthosepion pharaonis]|uniref:Uncharacterized protein n=1 Tax=Acanthosepion pharaonis TaxID=158019 RepID=A0A812BCJ2_ACAPH|nr:unnamed protein product [Sepia pharaonis]